MQYLAIRDLTTSRHVLQLRLRLVQLAPPSFARAMRPHARPHVEDDTAHGVRECVGRIEVWVDQAHTGEHVMGRLIHGIKCMLVYNSMRHTQAGKGKEEKGARSSAEEETRVVAGAGVRDANV